MRLNKNTALSINADGTYTNIAAEMDRITTKNEAHCLSADSADTNSQHYLQFCSIEQAASHHLLLYTCLYMQPHTFAHTETHTELKVLLVHALHLRQFVKFRCAPSADIHTASL